jgi:hypothetical protein
MAFQEKQLGQVRPANTTAVSIYSPATSTTGIIKNIVICNTSAAAAKARLFLDDDGATYDETTALFWDVQIDVESTIQLDGHWGMNNSSGNLAVRTDIASALTFTVHGVEVT